MRDVGGCYANDHHLTIGESDHSDDLAGNSRRFVVRATYPLPLADPLLPSVAISQSAFDRTFPQPQDEEVLVDVKGGVNPATTATLQHALAAYPDTSIKTLPLGVFLAALATRGLSNAARWR